MPQEEDKDCGKTHTYNYHGEEEPQKSKQVSDAQLDEIIDRLYKTQTKSSSGGCEQGASEDDGDKKKGSGKTNKEVDDIVERLYNQKTEAMKEHEQPALQDQISSKKVMSSGDMDNIVERLYSTHTESSSGELKGARPKNEIARKPASEEEMKEIYDRLKSAQTKSSAGGKDCKPADPPKTPGLGLKMYPIIEGIEERFKGKSLTEEQAMEIMNRLKSTETGASKARKGFPHILLYPERTILHNNTGRIRSYQETGTMSRQKELARREKWYN